MVTFKIHLDPVENGVCWWAESDQIPGWFAASSESLADLRAGIRESAAWMVEGPFYWREELVV